MDRKGKLVRWNAERGFGFIACDDLDKEVFVHISTLKAMPRLPVIGDVIIFKVEIDDDGKLKAAQAYIEGLQAQSVQPTTSPPLKMTNNKGKRGSSFGSLALVAAVVVVVFVVNKFNQVTQPSAATIPTEQRTPVEVGIPEPQFHCDGRQHCSQMTSCAEARFFIQNCPNTKMDGDRDGIPCEKQWC